MITHPFHIFEPYQDHLAIHLCTKADELLNEDGLVSLKQIHGNNVVIARSPSQREKEADGVLTDQPDLTLTIRIADCQAFVVYAPRQHMIGLLHAGWKGLVSGIIPSFFQTMNDKWNVDPATVLIGAAPSLCTNCAEFTDPVTELVGINPRFFDGRNADLRAIADDQLMKCGVKAEYLERSPDCTKCNPDTYWTYRGGDREAVTKGSTNVLTCCLKKRK
jgi:polyphenol oxidase